MATAKILIGKETEAGRVEFEQPRRTVFVYFGKDEGASFGAGICHLPPHSSNQRHAHDNADEIIYVLKGTLRFWFPDQEHILKAPEAIYIPRNVEHQIFNDTDQVATHTFTFTPPGPEIAIRNKYR